MKMEIKCSTCNEVMGTVEKDVFSDTDQTTYRAMMTCPNGHKNTVLVEAPPEEPAAAPAPEEV